MPRRKGKEFIQKNRIKEAVIEAGASQRLVSLWLDVNYTSISPWNTNKSQPEEENLDKIGELLEEDNRMLLEPQGRVKTGLAKALQAELDRLAKEEGIPYEIERFSKEKGKSIKVNNPQLIKKLKDFADNYKKKNRK